jgi:hypothetical protein
MKHDLTSEVGGKPLAFAREFLQRGLSFTVSGAARLLKEEDCEAVVNYLGALVDAGYLERDSEASANDRPELYRPTRLGVSLRKVKIRARIARSMADKHLTALLAAIERVNSDPDLLSWVDEADVFGSFSEGSDDVGDVDVAVLVSHRAVPKGWTRASYERAKAAGVNGNHIKMITWGEEEIWRELRKASRYLDLQPKDEIEAMGCLLTPVYRRKR